MLASVYVDLAGEDIGTILVRRLDDDDSLRHEATLRCETDRKSNRVLGGPGCHAAARAIGFLMDTTIFRRFFGKIPDRTRTILIALIAL